MNEFADAASATAIAARLQAVHAAITAACARHDRDPVSVRLLAVSKRHPAAAVVAALAAGQHAFGENRVQELRAKADEVERTTRESPTDGPPLVWHMVGALQTNKVNALLRVPRLELLHSLDRPELADVLQAALERDGRQLDVLLEVNASGEEQKHGVAPGAAVALLRHVLAKCPRVSVRGVMAMGPLHGNAATAFARAASVRHDLEQVAGRELPVLSLGMTGDLEEAIAAGSTLVRIGTGVFGSRG